MNKKNLVSIIIPAYNTEDYIEECIESILNQTYIYLEIIIINDGSDDKTGEICQKYADIDKRIKYIEERNGGVSKARNVGLRMAKGDYITFVDSDDTISPIYVELLLDMMLSTKADLSVAGYSFIKDMLIIQNAKETYICWEQRKAIIEAIVSNDFNLNISSKLYSRGLIEGLFFDEETYLCEDKMFLFNAIVKSRSVAYSDQKIYWYRRREGSAINSSFDNRVYREIEAYESIYRSFCDNDLENERIYRKILIDGYEYVLWRGFMYSDKTSKVCKNTLLEQFGHIKIIDVLELYPMKKKIRIICQKYCPVFLQIYGRCFRRHFLN